MNMITLVNDNGDDLTDEMMWELDIIEQRHQNAGMHLYSFSFLLIINWPFHFT
jgi:hypothetical protein